MLQLIYQNAPEPHSLLLNRDFRGHNVLKLYCNRGTATENIVYWLVRKCWQVIEGLEAEDLREWKHVIRRALVRDKLIVAKLQKAKAVALLRMPLVWVEIGKFN